jgi:23S rRNA pseudouridine2605 synthase
VTAEAGDFRAGGERLQKVMAQAGIGSRRACEELIAAGRVAVNGSLAELGRRVDVEHDRITVDGVPVAVAPGLVYYLLNKPAGVVSDRPRVFPVGRLDADSEGLIILTNDGELTHRLTHPSYGVEKEYLVSVEGVPTAGTLRRLREGVELSDGPTAPAKVSAVAPGTLRVTIHEGRNRQVRRMGEAVGHPVTRLVRTRIGPLRVGSLRPGQWRPLTVAEVRALERAVAPAAAAARAARRAPKGRPADG